MRRLSRPSLPAIVRFLLDELLDDPGDLARRICRLSLALSWPGLLRVVQERRSSASATPGWRTHRRTGPCWPPSVKRGNFAS
jgi:hypothetical protein